MIKSTLHHIDYLWLDILFKGHASKQVMRIFVNQCVIWSLVESWVNGIKTTKLIFLFVSLVIINYNNSTDTDYNHNNNTNNDD